MTESNNTADNANEMNHEQRHFNQHHNVFNVAELIANEKVYDIMERMELCTCEKCVCDVLALALNSLPPKYVTSDAGKQYIQLDAYKRQFETDVAFALMRASQTVKASPSHEK